MQRSFPTSLVRQENQRRTWYVAPVLQRRRRRPRPIPPVSKSTMRTMSRMVIMGEALPATE